MHSVKSLKKHFKSRFYIPTKFKKQLLVTLAIALSIPVGAVLVQSIQSLMSRAAPGNATLSIVPAMMQKNPGETGSFDVFLNPNGEAVNGMEMYLTYNSNLVEVTSVTVGPFFTDPAGTVGQPLEIVKRIEPGKVSYVVAFPIGSNYSSTSAKNAVKINYTAKADGVVDFAFSTTGTPYTQITDVNAQNVMASATGGVLQIGGQISSGARLYFSAPRPANPQRVGTTFDIDVLMDTGGQAVDGVDVKARFDPTILGVSSITKATGNGLTSYPVSTFDNTAGSVTVSANVGSGTTTTPVNGTNILIATLRINPKAITSGTQITYDFAAGNRNDSNIVLTGTSQTGDPVDILASVTNASINVSSSTTATSTPTPTTVAATSTPTPTPLATGCYTLFDGWRNAPFASKTGKFNLSFEATPSGSSVDAVIGVSPTTAVLYSDLAATVRFYTNGRIEALNGSNYTASSVVNYTAGTKYIFNLAIDLTTRTYSATVAPVGGPSKTIATNYAFRPEQSGATSLSNVGMQSETGSATVCNIQASASTIATSTPTAVPTTFNTPTPTTVANSPTPTITGPRSLIVKFAFQGRIRTGVSKAKAVAISYRSAAGGTVTTTTVNTNTNGEGTLSLLPGSYVFLAKTPGYLAKGYGNSLNPVVINTSTTGIDFTPTPLLGGDFNGDGEVNEIDYASYFLTTFRTNNALVDLDGSGEVNNLDFGIMRTNWGLRSNTI